MITIDSQWRPHIHCECHGPCWCKPRVEECEHGSVTVHRDVEVRPDTRPRMSVYSEQLKFGLT